MKFRYLISAIAGAFRRERPQDQSCYVPDRNGAAVSISEWGIRGADLLGKVSELRWDEITGVLWCEPEYGFFEGVPYWVIQGARGTIIEIEDKTGGSADEHVPRWLARRLPGFDPGAVKAAFADGYFRQPGTQHLVCWSPPDEQNGRPDV